MSLRLAVIRDSVEIDDGALLSALSAWPGLDVVDVAPAAAKPLARRLEAEGVAAVLATGVDPQLLAAAAAAAKRCGCPALLRTDWNDLEEHGLLERWRRRRTVRKFRTILAVGTANRRFVERCGVGSARIGAAPIGVDIDELTLSGRELRPRRRELREQMGISPDWFCALFVDPLEEPYRPFDVLASLAAGRRENSALRLLILGEGSLEGELRRRVREQRLPVTFAERRDRGDRISACAAADAVVCPGDARVRWSRPVHEAMACGLAAVVSLAVGFREDLIEDGVTGFTHDVGDAAGLVACLTTLASDPIRAAVMGDAARLRASTHSLEREIAGIVEALHRLVPRAGGEAG